VALTSAPARARLIIYDKFGAVGELNADVSNPLISPGISDGDRIHLVVHVDTKAANVCRQPGKGLYPLPFAAMELNRTQFELFSGFVEVNNAAGGCSTPGDDQTGVARLLIGPVDMTLFGLGQVGESVPSPLFSPDRVDGYFGLAIPYADVIFEAIRVREVVPETASLLQLAGGLAAARNG
jgi:hypothetical protein